jgi:unsaturated rhamnogalacturonyl hydrolase
MAAHARTLDLLPAGDPRRAATQDDLRAMAGALLQVQRDDGFWNTSLIDPVHCSDQNRPDEDGPQTSATAWFTYGIAWAIRTGFLDESRLGPDVVNAWNGLVSTALHPDGTLGYLQATGAQPCDPDGSGDLAYGVVPHHDDVGVGCFLLAGSEVARLVAR